MASRRQEKIYYGWVIVAASLVVATIFVGNRFCFGIFFKSIQSDFDLSRTATSSVYSVFMLINAIVAILSGWVLDKYGPKLTVCLMGLFTGLSLIITSQTHSLWQIYLSYSLLLSAGVSGNMSALMPVVSRWFRGKKRGLALGIFTMSSGLGTLALAPLAAFLISNLGWRFSLMVLGILALVVVLPLSMLMRRAPSEIAISTQDIDSSNSSLESVKKSPVIQVTGLSLKLALKTRGFWLMVIVLLLNGVCWSMLSTHVVPHATDIGILPLEASVILSIMGGAQIITRPLVGRFLDLIGRKIPGIFCAMLVVGAVVWLTRASDLWSFYLFAAIFGLAWGGLGVAQITIISDKFGGPSLGLIMGTLEAGYSIGSAIGPIIGGSLFDLTNSYLVAFFLAAASMFMVAIILGSMSLKDTSKGYASWESSP